jgi:SpoVK/Ycf46/Vps4 family AAA+-type ATPase
MLHGPTGTGKNYIAKMLVNSMFHHGTNSTFVNLWSSSVHFLDPDKLNESRNEIQEFILDASKRCNEQVYIFDEAKRYPPGLLNALAPFFDDGHPYSLG